MRNLSIREIKEYQSRIDRDVKNYGLDRGTYEADCDKFRDVRAQFTFPLGELANRHISGFVWGWGMKGKLNNQQPITDKDRFNAQGLEGKIVIDDCTLMDCLVWSLWMDEGRYNIWVN